MDTESPNSELPEDWRKTWFENAHSEIRWSKEQGWRALEGSVLLLAGIAAASVSLSGLPVIAIVLMVSAVVVLVAWYMVDLHRSAAKSRKWCDDIVPTRPGPARTFDPDHRFYLLTRIAVVLVAGGLVVWIATV